LTAVDITVADVTSIEGIDKGPGRLDWCLNGSGAGGGWVVDGADVCPGAPTGGPEPIVAGAATLVVDAVAEAL
jgi:hypothetical protein